VPVWRFWIHVILSVSLWWSFFKLDMEGILYTAHPVPHSTCAFWFTLHSQTQDCNFIPSQAQTKQNSALSHYTSFLLLSHSSTSPVPLAEINTSFVIAHTRCVHFIVVVHILCSILIYLTFFSHCKVISLEISTYTRACLVLPPTTNTNMMYLDTKKCHTSY
jgi:hypothetical protein